MGSEYAKRHACPQVDMLWCVFVGRGGGMRSNGGFISAVWLRGLTRGGEWCVAQDKPRPSSRWQQQQQHHPPPHPDSQPQPTHRPPTHSPTHSSTPVLVLPRASICRCQQAGVGGGVTAAPQLMSHTCQAPVPVHTHIRQQRSWFQDGSALEQKHPSCQQCPWSCGCTGLLSWLTCGTIL